MQSKQELARPKFSVRAQGTYETKEVGTSPFFDGAIAIALEHHKQTHLAVWIVNVKGVTIYRIKAKPNLVKHAGGGR